MLFPYNIDMAKFTRKTREERSLEIIEAAKTVFLKKGFRHTTMEDIVAATTLSKGGVYQYFKSTKAIMFAIMEAGNYFRYKRNEEIFNAVKDIDDIYEIVTQALMIKLFDEVPEKRLYLMFLAEIIYDKEYEELFLQLEDQAHKFISENLEHLFVRKNLAGKKIKYKTNKAGKLYSRFFNGILIMYELFEDKTIFDKKEIHDLIYSFVKKSFVVS
ncbi:TetR/AcrR family transcriptional regulator [Treponema sp. OMZ 787]|uniref:TetR/AcrR family transcriptional regulator n=1 Tax=Treponema sp. OMZ 787 TaxID=2563669 RepID=UPI0020A239A7|nr:TetR/AcrR family transcriptional regulator [Treponema sp. OMZ 787]UTC63541.1 TetR/AcrR family transcriptional regulator [Treponema sp. OMZ 787]